ncbi:MAG: helix-turn-helix domain-containing protein [Ruminococcaceae bacterium]|nr:helix-turn-helix domain-containing protein [Oscillospiraceae bacterium]
MTDKTIIGQRIAKLRKNLGLTQAELADKLGVSHQAVSQWERSETLPDILTLPRIADVFGESISYLLGITETAQAEKKEDTADQPDDSSHENGNDAIVYDIAGVRVEISNAGVSLPDIVKDTSEDVVEEKVLEMVDNTVEIPVDGGDYSIVLERNGERIKIPWDLQERVTVILKGDCEDVSCDFALRIEGDVEGDVSAIGSVSVGGDVNGDISTNCEDVSCDFALRIEGDVEGDVSAIGSVSVGGDVNGDISTNGTVAVGGDVSGDIDTNGAVSVGGDVSGDIDTNSCISVGGDVDGDIDADGDIRISGDLNGDANAEGNITVHGDMN